MSRIAIFFAFAALIVAPSFGTDLPSSTPSTPITSDAFASEKSVVDSLLDLMVTKGLLNSSEVISLKGAPSGQELERLVRLMQSKGMLSAEDISSLAKSLPIPAPSPNTNTSVAEQKPSSAPSQVSAVAPSFIRAVTPHRVLPVDPPKREGLIPDIKIGPVYAKPYGFLKASAVHDTSSPRGDDLPLPFFMFGDSGPSPSPEFHMKARSSRFGSNFEWPDPSPKLTVTGKIEFDFEGNFTAVDNRNVSSLRSSMPSLRLAWGRLDYAATNKTTIFGVFGQDWTVFGSSTMPGTLETTGVGLGFGSLYERDPQMRGGFVHNFGGTRTTKLLAEVAAVMPGFGNVPSGNYFQIPGTVIGTNTGSNILTIVGCATPPCGTVTIPQTANTGLGLAEQLAYGERQGADSARPGVQARAVIQFQLDKAPGVAPAQFILSGEQQQRTATVPVGNIPLLSTGSLPSNFFKSAFPRGLQVSSDSYGITYEAQIPTRWATLVAKYYRGGDLRWFFGGQLFSYYNDTAGLSNVITVPSIDGSALVALGNVNGLPTIAPARAVRAAGGFGELGLPLSRWFNADPKGRNAGWTATLHYGIDQANASDVRKAAPGGARGKSDWAFANLQYKLNNYVTFGYEESLYRTRTLSNSTTGLFTGTLWKGVPAKEAQDIRSEFTTMFSF